MLTLIETPLFHEAPSCECAQGNPRDHRRKLTMPLPDETLRQLAIPSVISARSCSNPCAR